jgi:hypothetical protein
MLNGTTSFPAEQHMCNLYPNIHPFVLANPHLASVSIPRRGTNPDLVWCQICPLARTSMESAAVILASAISSAIAVPVAHIMCWTGSTLKRRSNVLLSGSACRPHDFIIFLWNAVSIKIVQGVV